MSLSIFCLVISVLVGVICLFIISYFNLKIIRRRRKGEPPIIRGHILWGNCLDFSSNAVKFFQETSKKFGPIFTIRLLNQHLTLVMDPEAYEIFSRTKEITFDPIQEQVNRNVFGYKLRDAHTMIRETSKSVKGKKLRENLKVFVNNLNFSFEKIKFTKKYQMPLRTFAAKTIFKSIFFSIFGNQNGSFSSDKVFKNFEIFHKYFNYLWLGLPIYFFPEAKKALDQLLLMPNSNELLKRKDLTNYIREAILHMLSRKQTEVDIKGHNLVFLHVNYNTFRLAYWALYFLITEEGIWEKLEKEMNQILGDLEMDEKVEISEKKLNNMPLLSSFIQETSRMVSGVFVVRHVVKETQIKISDGKKYKLREGDKIAIYPPAFHKDEEIFHQPEVFQCDRFFGEKFFYKNKKKITNPIKPFGCICPGKHFAILQLKIYLVFIISKFKYFKKKNSDVLIKPEVKYHGHEILPPKNDCEIVFELKKNSSQFEFILQN